MRSILCMILIVTMLPLFSGCTAAVDRVASTETWNPSNEDWDQIRKFWDAAKDREDAQKISNLFDQIKLTYDRHIEKTAALKGLPLSLVNASCCGLARLYFGRGSALLAVNEYKEAISDFENGLKACAKMELNNQEKQEDQDKQHQISKDGLVGALNLNLARALVLEKRYEDAVAAYDRAREQTGAGLRNSVCAEHCQASEAAGKAEKAASIRKEVEALNTSPDSSPEYWLEKGSFLRAIGHFDEALAAFEHARQLKADDIRILYGLAACSLHAGDSSKAIEIFEECGRLWPTDVGVKSRLHYARALAFFQKGQYGSSLKEIWEAERFYSHDRYALTLRAKVLEQLGKKEEAESYGYLADLVEPAVLGGANPDSKSWYERSSDPACLSYDYYFLLQLFPSGPNSSLRL
ncbi:MAG: tetratricopeptide repeat protein [Cyanobacteria bacterium HKST-UBA02]|nr:tetratricopeptide repeat protein [Cyanobacteria bacterium HKST-UBA02]